MKFAKSREAPIFLFSVDMCEAATAFGRCWHRFILSEADGYLGNEILAKPSIWIAN